MKATRKDNRASTYHRDGTVSLWDIHQQRWVRLAAEDVSDEVLATLSETERSRIARMAS